MIRKRTHCEFFYLIVTSKILRRRQNYGKNRLHQEKIQKGQK